jgi:hypothetical protein
MNDGEFIAAFEACAIAKSDFHHADHVRLAWLYLRAGTTLEAMERFTAALQRFARHHGVPGLYHETITWAYLLLIRERMERDGAPGDWPSFCAVNEDLLARNPSILERYYRPQTLRSEMARRIFVMPDAGVSGA